MISVYAGRPGAGKSYSAVCNALEEMARGRLVVTNLPLNVKAVRAWLMENRHLRRNLRRRTKRGPLRLLRIFGWLLRTRRRPRFQPTALGGLVIKRDVFFEHPAGWEEALALGVRDGGRGAVIIVDEAGARFDVLGLAPPEIALRFRKALQEHRHYYASIIFLMQSHHHMDPVGPRVKNLVEHWCEVVNLRYGTGIKAYERCVYASHYGKDRVPLSTMRGRYRKHIFKLYRSHDLGRMAGAAELGLEQDVAVGGTVRWKLVFALCLVVCSLVAFVVLGYKAVNQGLAMLSPAVGDLEVGIGIDSSGEDQSEGGGEDQSEGGDSAAAAPAGAGGGGDDLGSARVVPVKWASSSSRWIVTAAGRPMLLPPRCVGSASGPSMVCDER